MLRLLCIVGFAALALPYAPAAQEPASDADLMPSLGFYSFDEPEPYDVAVRDALLGQHRYRKCQLVVIPSFKPEWAMYVIRDEDSPPQLLVKRMRRQLWSQMMRVISDDGTKTSYSIGPDAQEAALSELAIETDVWTKTLSGDDADVFEEVWSRLLSRVHYSDSIRGDDGVTYYFSHWARGFGFRSGETWSPREGTRPAALVRLAEHLRTFIETGDQRSIASARSEARDLLTSLE